MNRNTSGATKISRRKFLKKSLLLSGILALPAGYAYSRFYAPLQIELVDIHLHKPRLPKAFAKKRIVLFSDIHIDYHFGLARMEDLIHRIEQLQPDMLCFTGDLYHESIGSPEERSATSRLLQRLHAPLGKWAVLGNHDYIAGAEKVEEILTEGGFNVLVNTSQVIELEGQRLQVAGLDDAFWGNADFARTLQGADPNLFTLLLAHEPDLANQSYYSLVDLQLSGHSHGGQVKLPLIGPLVLPSLAELYPEGLYHIGDRLTLYTNRGIGVSTHPIRFMCPPEITILHLQK